MSAARILGSAYPVLLLVALLVVATVCGVLAVRKERKDLSSFTQRPEYLTAGGWTRPGNRGEDDAALDDAELAETGRVRPAADRLRTPPAVLADAEEAARHAVERDALVHLAKTNALHHP